MHSALKLMPDPIPEVPRDGAIGSGQTSDTQYDPSRDSGAFNQVYDKQVNSSSTQPRQSNDVPPPLQKDGGNRAQFDPEVEENNPNGNVEHDGRQQLTAEQLRELAAEKAKQKAAGGDPEHITRPMEKAETGIVKDGKGEKTDGLSALDKLMGLVEGSDKLVRQQGKQDGQPNDEMLKQHKLANAIDSALVDEKNGKADNLRSVSDVLRSFTETGNKAEKLEGKPDHTAVKGSESGKATDKSTLATLGLQPQTDDVQASASNSNRAISVDGKNFTAGEKLLSQREIEALRAKLAGGRDKFIDLGNGSNMSAEEKLGLLSGQTPDIIEGDKTDKDMVIKPAEFKLDGAKTDGAKTDGKFDKDIVIKPAEFKLDGEKVEQKELPRDTKPPVDAQIKPKEIATGDIKPREIVGQPDKKEGGLGLSQKADKAGETAEQLAAKVAVDEQTQTTKATAKEMTSQTGQAAAQQVSEEALAQNQRNKELKPQDATVEQRNATQTESVDKFAQDKALNSQQAIDPLVAPNKKAEAAQPFVAATGKVDKRGSNILGNKPANGKSATDNIVTATADKAIQAQDAEKQQAMEQQQNFDGQQEPAEGMFDELVTQHNAKEAPTTNIKTTGQFSNTLNQFSVDSASRLNAATQTLNATGTEKAPPQLTETLNMTRPDISNQMKERMTIMMNRGIQVADIRLDPAELGQMQVRMSVENDVTSVNFVVQNGQAKEMLEQMMPKLKDMLAEQGVEMGESSVSQQDSGAQDTEQTAGDSQGHGQMAGGENIEGEHEQQVVQEIKIANGALGGIDYFA